MNLTFGLNIDIVLLRSRRNHGGLDAEPVAGLHLRSLLPLLLALLSLEGGRQGDKYTLMSAGPGLVVGAVKQLQNPSRFFSTLLCPLHWWKLTACIIILSDWMILRQMNRIIQYICTMKGTIKMFKS